MAKQTHNVDIKFQALDKVSGPTKKMGGAVKKTSADFKKGSAAIKGFSQNASQMGAMLPGVGGNIAMIGSNMALLPAAAALAGAAMVKSLWNIGQAAADANDEIFDLSVRFGMAAEEVSKWGFIAEQNGATVTDLGNAFKTLSKNAATDTAAFAKWGLELRKSNGEVKTMDELFNEAIQHVAGIENNVLKAAAAQDLFGRSGSNMLQILSLNEDQLAAVGEKASDYGAIISEEAAVAGNRFNNELHATETSLGALKRVLGDEVLPEMENFIKAVGEVANKIRSNENALKAMVALIAPISSISKAYREWKGEVEEITLELVPLVETTDKATDSYNKNTVAAKKNAEGKRAKAKADREEEKAQRKFWAEQKKWIAEVEREQVAQEKKRQAAINASIADFHNWFTERDASIAEWNANMQAQWDQQVANQQELDTIMQNTAQSMAAGMGQAFAAIALGADDAGKQMSMAVINAAETAINAYAVSGAAAAAFSQAGIPILGPFLAITASSMLFGLIKGLLAQLPSFEQGGIVRGGIPFKDSVPVMAQDGEGFLSRDDTKTIRHLISAVRGGGGAAGGITINVQQQNLAPQAGAEMARSGKEISKILKRAQKRGF